MVSSRVSDVLGWEYYVFYDMKGGQFAGARLSGAMLVMLLLIAAGAFIMVSYALYRPVGKLVKDVSDVEQKITGNELNFLADRFANMKNDKQILENVLTQQQDKLQELFELRLIRGEVRSSDEWEEYFNELHLQPCKNFATAVMVLDLRGENDTQSSVNEDAICLQMVQELPEELKKLTWMPLVYNACTIFCLFGDDDEGILLKRITEFYEGIQKFSESRYGFRILMGVSTTHTNFRHIRAAYRESVNALTMQSKGMWEPSGAEGEAGENNLTDDECRFYLASTTIHGSTYNNSFEKDIQTAIKAVDKEQCYKVTDEFGRYLSELEQHDEALVYILRYANTILLTALDARVDLDKVYPDGLKKVYRELIEVIEPSRVRRYLKSVMVDPIIRARNELLEESSYSMLEEIERQIRESKGNITLTECADALGVHQTYIWKILKMEKGKSFSDYLEEYKLEEAKRLLLQTNMTVAEIATELNYTNAQNFIRFFSKSTGLTPGKFRKLY